MNALDRFMGKVERTQGCWLWKGATWGRWKYGQFWFEGKHVSAHRWIYEMTRNPIPKGLVIDHLCRTPVCVRPDHLEVVSMAENNLRGMAPPAINARKIVCKRGHPYTYSDKSGRRCRQCMTEMQRQRRERSRAA